MKDTYLAKDFRATAARRFPAKADALNAAFDARLQALRADNAAAGKEKLPSGKADPARHRSL